MPIARTGLRGSVVVLNLIECDVLYEDLRADYVSYGTMFDRYFSQLSMNTGLPAFHARYYSAIERRLPTPQRQAVYLITGSKFGAYEDAQWITELEQWIQQAFHVGARLIGVCFGHQIIAQALGGKVIKSEKGWGVGVRSLPHLNPAFSSSLPDQVKLIYSHQDQVVKLPNGATALLGDEFCPFASYTIDKQVLTFQGHPEFDAVYTRRLLGRRASCMGHDRFEQAMNSLSEDTDSAVVGKMMLDWMTAGN